MKKPVLLVTIALIILVTALLIWRPGNSLVDPVVQASRSNLNIKCKVIVPQDLEEIKTFYEKDGEQIQLNAHEMYENAFREGWEEYLERFQSGEIDLDEINEGPYLAQEWGLSMNARYEGFMKCRQDIVDYSKKNRMEFKPLKDEQTKQLLNSGADLDYPGSSSHIDSEPKGITLRGEEITDKQLEPIRHFREAISLDIIGTSVSDKGLGHIQSLINLWKLELAGTLITDEGIKQLLGFKKLELLDLSNTAVTDKGVSLLAEIPSLEVIDLRGTSITDKSLVALSSLPKLRCLYLGSAEDESVSLDLTHSPSDGSLDAVIHQNHPRKIMNQPVITDASLTAIKKMKKLETLSLEGTSISDDGIKQLQRVIPNIKK